MRSAEAMAILVGTSGYNYPEWRGTFYPAAMKPAAMLRYYAERFTTVEINATFYRMPTAKAIEGWAAAIGASDLLQEEDEEG